MGSLSHPLSCGLIAIMVCTMATFPLSQLFGSSKSSKHARTTAYAILPPHEDRYEVSLELVTIAGTEYGMQADLSQYEDVAELEDDILCFLPTVSDLMSSATFTLSNPCWRHSARCSAATATTNCSSSLHGRRTFHLAVPGRRKAWWK